MNNSITEITHGKTQINKNISNNLFFNFSKLTKQQMNQTPKQISLFICC